MTLLLGLQNYCKLLSPVSICSYKVLVHAPRVYYVAINIYSHAQRLPCSCDMTWLLLLVSYPSPICVFVPEQHDMMRGMIHSCNMSLDTGADIVESWKYNFVPSTEHTIYTKQKWDSHSVTRCLDRWWWMIGMVTTPTYI